MRRTFDILVVLPALVILAPVLVMVALAIKLTSRGPVLFRQERMGRGLKPFRILKFRTMVEGADQMGPGVTVQGDPRVTGIGAVLRKTKLDELPQLFNVLMGDMSLVGPRPELPAYVDRFGDQFREILKVRPGITDPASIVYRDEAALLEKGADPEELYLRVILPHKLRLAKAYVERASLWGDIMVILKTLACLVSRSGSRDASGQAGTHHRRYVALGVEAALVAAAYYLALYLRHDGAVPRALVHYYLVTAPFLVLLRVALLLGFGLHRARWRHSGLKSLESLTAAVALGTIAFWAVVRLGPNDELISNQVIVLEGMLSLMLLGGARAIRRAWFSFASEPRLSKKVLVVGSGRAAEPLLRELVLHRIPEYRAIGLIDPDPEARGLRVHGIPVLGTARDFGSVVGSVRPDEVWIAGRIEPAETQTDVVRQCLNTGIALKALPDLEELLANKQLLGRLRRVEPEDLLFREPIPADVETLQAYYAGKRVLITGAGGSIGSEIARQAAACQPESLVLFEKHEASLYQIDRELQGRFPEVPIEAVIGDVTDPRRVREIMAATRPQAVVHAAAYKHVPMMERNPSEAFKTNTAGTKIVAEAARETGAEIFLLISTDKAVEPASVMGLSKRLAELAIQRMPNRQPTRFMAVRFGNVLASSGSVVPLFEEQIARGGPVTVTDPEVTRLFMTAREAVHLVLQAGTMGSGGEVFVLDMGKPVRILDLAVALIRLYGYTPDEDIRIVFTGLRPGERRYEKLFNDHEKVWKTSHPKILMAANSDRGAREGDEVLKLLSVFNGRIPIGQVAELQATLKQVLA